MICDDICKLKLLKNLSCLFASILHFFEVRLWPLFPTVIAGVRAAWKASRWITPDTWGVERSQFDVHLLKKNELVETTNYW